MEHDDYSNDGRVTHYYSRAERLKKAPQIVRDMYDPSKQMKGGLFRVLVATRPLKIMFFSLILIFLITLVIMRMMGSGSNKTFLDNSITVSAVSAGENSYITIKKTAVNQQSYVGLVGVALTLAEEDPPHHIEWIVFGTEPEQVFQFTVPFSGERILVLLEADGEQLGFSVRP